MADAAKVIVKTAVSASSPSQTQGLANFNTAMTTAIAAAQVLAAYPSTANVPTTIDGFQPVYCDPVGMTFDGTNYTYFSAVNYAKYV